MLDTQTNPSPMRLPMPYFSETSRSFISLLSHILAIPRYLTRNFAHTLQSPIPQLHRTKLDHPRIQPQRLPYIVLYLTRGVVSHDEVVPVGVLRLVLSRSLGEIEDAPILDTSDSAA
jgi:hypothetical protein